LHFATETSLESASLLARGTGNRRLVKSVWYGTQAVSWLLNMTTQSKSEQLRAPAHKCEAKAEAARDPDVRWLYRDMAAQYRQMARQRDELGLYDRG
jgi:hypothetical protein